MGESFEQDFNNDVSWTSSEKNQGTQEKDLSNEKPPILFKLSIIYVAI